MNSKEQVRQIKRILDALVKAEKTDNDTAESIHDRELAKLNTIIDSSILNSVKEAIGDNTKRKKVSVYVFAQLYNVSGIDQVFLDLLNSVDTADRDIIIQTIGLRKLKAFVPILNAHYHNETDTNCKEQLISTLGTLADESSFPIFLNLTQTANKNQYWRLIWALKNFGKEEGKPFLEKVFNDNQSDTSDKVVAAWGLIKIGDKSYYDYLLKTLDDPDIETPTSYSPGQSMRAAQAICDINNWDFVWNKDYVAVVKERLKDAS
jgi:hypothetical protein